MTDRPDTVRLAHKAFGMFVSPIFRRADTDQAPVLTIRMDERDVSMPLRSLAREFNLGEDTADGKMLHLIVESLEFVAALRIGDKLPSEVLTGAASWEPSPEHIRIANARLQIRLVDWLRSGSGADPLDVTPENLAAGDIDPHVREIVQDAMVRAADALGLSSTGDVIKKIEVLAQELAYIEALRDRLLNRVQSMAVKLERQAHVRASDGSPTETLTRVRQLTGTALRQLRQRFDEQDAHIGEVTAALRHIETHKTFIRNNRDWLYRSQRAWDPILTEWDATDGSPGDATRSLLTKTYHFLAPRFMPVTEWVSFLNPKPKAKVRGMEW
jgi:hypothetical protein